MRVLALIACAFLLAPDAFAVIDAGGRISRVTVYPDRAEVTRSADVPVPAGRSELRFTRLPDGVDPDSLTIGARGLTASLGSIEWRTDVVTTAPDSDRLEAEAEIRRVADETARLTAEEANDRELRLYLQSLRDASAKTQVANGAGFDPDADALKRMFAFLRDAHAEITAREVARQLRRAALDDQARAAATRRDAAPAATRQAVRSVIVDVEAAQAGTLRVDLAYAVGGASWRPAYRAALDPAKGNVSLTSEAVVAQATGEDWTDVALTLSTSAPDEGLEAPVLMSWMVVAQDLGIGAGSSAQIQYRIDGQAGNDPVDGGLTLNVPTAAITSFRLITSGASAKYGEQSTGVARVIHAGLLSTGYDVSYVVPGRSDVASDSAEHRVTLRTDELEAEISYRIVPSLSEAAFAEARVTTPADRALLPGTVRVVTAGTLLGEFDLEETPPGETLRIPFGADNRIKVARTALPAERTERGGAKERQVRAAFRTSIESRRDGPVSVTVEDRLPVAEDDRIVVKLGDATTPGSKESDDRPGVVAWTFDLKPREKRDVTLEYVVRHPKEIVIAGL